MSAKPTAQELAIRKMQEEWLKNHSPKKCPDADQYGKALLDGNGELGNGEDEEDILEAIEA